MFLDIVSINYAKSFLLTIGASWSKDKVFDRNRNKAVFIGLHAVPGDEQIKGRNRVSPKRQMPFFASRIALFGSPKARHHGKNRLDHHALVPPPTPTNLHVRGNALLVVKMPVTQNHRLVRNAAGKLEKSRIVSIGGRDVEIDNLAEPIDLDTDFSAHNPSLVGYPFFAVTLRGAPLADRMDEFGAVAVYTAKNRRIRQKTGREGYSIV